MSQEPQVVRQKSVTPSLVEVDEKEHDAKALVILTTVYENLGGPNDGEVFESTLILCPSHALSLRDWLNEHSLQISEAIVLE